MSGKLVIGRDTSSQPQANFRIRSITWPCFGSTVGTISPGSTLAEADNASHDPKGNGYNEAGKSSVSKFYCGFRRFYSRPGELDSEEGRNPVADFGDCGQLLNQVFVFSLESTQSAAAGQRLFFQSDPYALAIQDGFLKREDRWVRYWRQRGAV